MKAQDIHVGDKLWLKQERAEAYGMNSGYRLIVTAIVPKPKGYKTPWIIARTEYDAVVEAGYYKPSDFAANAS